MKLFRSYERAMLAVSLCATAGILPVISLVLIAYGSWPMVIFIGLFSGFALPLVLDKDNFTADTGIDKGTVSDRIAWGLLLFEFGILALAFLVCEAWGMIVIFQSVAWERAPIGLNVLMFVLALIAGIKGGVALQRSCRYKPQISGDEATLAQ
ncbi:MAG: hypothetical protein V1826_01130 [bacterium]